MPSRMKQFYNFESDGENDYYNRFRPKSSAKGEEEKPCTVCTDFKSMFKNLNNPVNEKECPLNKSELGNRTWSFLHTMAAYFPEKPSTQDSQDMSQFLKLFSRFYPCPTCAKDFAKLMDKEPPKTGSQDELKHWLCWAHNQVNKKLGKPKFDCSKLDERWKYGWKDGSCN